MQRKTQVFLSSSFRDNEARRRRVLDALDRLGFTPIAMERFTASPDRAEVLSVDRVTRADLFLGLLAWRYGTIPDGTGKSITELEYEAAGDQGIDRLMFVIDGTRCPMIPERDCDAAADRWPKQARLDEFKHRVAQEQTAAPFDDDNLDRLVMQALTQWRDRKGLAPEPAPVPPPDTDAEFEIYRQRIAAEHETLQLVGLPANLRVPIRLEDLYVDLRAHVDLRGSGDLYLSGDEAAEDPRLRESHVDVPLVKAFAEAKRRGGRRGIVILGDPGSGKTTHLRRLVLGLVRKGPRRLLGLPEDTLPVFLPLRNLAATDAGLDVFLEKQMQSPTLRLEAGFGRRLMTRGRLLILLDGLDEVPADRRDDVARWIEHTERDFGDSFLAVTCRYAGYTDAARLNERFLELHLRPLEPAQAEQFVRRWYETVETALAVDRDRAEVLAAQRAESLLQGLRGPEFRASRLATMTRNPLLLTAICLVHRDRGQLPHKRAKLYEDCVTVLLDTWRRAKGLPVTWDADRARPVLECAAEFLHDQEGRTRATASEIAPRIAEPLQRVGWQKPAAEFLATIRDESGLLVGWSGDQFGFLHLGFQEYLTARRLRAHVLAAAGQETEFRRRVAALAERFGASWWREVLLLTLATGETSLFDPLLKAVLARPELVDHTDLLDEFLAESLQTSAVPFVELLERDPGQDRGLADRQLIAARVVHRLWPAELRRLRSRLAGHPLAALRALVAEPAVTEFVRSERGGVELVRIPGGTFWMGCDPEVDGDADWMRHAKPLHQVTLEPFLLARVPVTNGEYAEFLKANPEAREPACWNDADSNQPDQPVVGVTWHDAQAFCRWAGLSLPSEAQWEYACRGQVGAGREQRTRFWSGNTDADVERVAWLASNSDGRPHAAGEMPANPFGLHDMHGNVWEWCGDVWHDTYEGAPGDGSARSGHASGSRVIRGGCFRDSAGSARSAYRFRWPPVNRLVDLGFRPARSVLTP